MVNKVVSTDLASMIDYAILGPETSRADIEKAIKRAKKYEIYSVCVPPYLVPATRQMIEGSKVKLTTVVGFPLGYSALTAKAEEARKAISEGAHEIDMSLNIAALRSGNINHVKEDIANITTLCHLHGRIVKVIVETALLTDIELEKVCKLCADAGVNFVKTSSGFFGGATEEDVTKLRSMLPPEIKIKAAGGIRTREKAISLIEAGALRIGTSLPLDIIKEEK